jgi:hypothetical protein
MSCMHANLNLISLSLSLCVCVWCNAMQEVRRKEERDYVEHPDAADKGFSRGLQFLRDRGVLLGPGQVRGAGRYID